jgi:hypothetical protein
MYSQLSTTRKEIRLLHLEPGVWTDTIHCRLLDVSLLDQPYYHALSYVWGDPKHREPITVDGRSWTITRNLFEALQRIRDEHSVVTLWVDALCINQADLDERSKQVQLMRDIYDSAEEVVIWLGYSEGLRAPQLKPKTYQWTEGDTDQAIVDEYFRESDNEEENDELNDTVGAFVYISLCASNKHLSEMPFFTQDDEKQARQCWPQALHALKMLISAPWWKRIWVLQEVVLARKATIIYGSTTAPWDMFVRAAKHGFAHDQYCCHEFLGSRPNEREEMRILVEFRRVVQDDVELLRSYRVQKTQLSLPQLMSQTLDRKATDPRDKVYGVLGLVTYWYHNEPLLPDYHLEFRQVLMNANLAQLRGSQSLRGLMGVPTNIPGLPSWIKQVSNSDEWRISQRSRVSRTAAYLAAGPTLAKVKLDGDTLVVDGFAPVDTVACVGPVLLQDSVAWEHIVGIITTWRQMCPPSAQDKQEAFWRTIVNDYTKWSPGEREKQKFDPGIVHSEFRRLEASEIAGVSGDWWEWLQSRMPGSKNMRELTKRAIDMPHVRLIHESFLGATALRSFFTTAGGRMGMGPPDLRPGDAIAILLGGDAPFCIRCNGLELGQNATLVGDVYVHGLMDGQGVPSNWQEEIIQISFT